MRRSVTCEWCVYGEGEVDKMCIRKIKLCPIQMIPLKSFPWILF